MENVVTTYELPKDCFSEVFCIIILYYLPPGSPEEDYNLHHVCACVRGCVRVSRIFGKLLVLMNFYALQYFLGLVNFGLLVSE